MAGWLYDPHIVFTASLAQQVAEENSAATGLGILITDCHGIVIGSSDPKRIGTFHEASLEVVELRRAVSHTARQAAALHGVRPGLTLPVIVDTEVVGTVGITGSPAGVRRLGPLVRRHTEMLLRESAALRTQLLHEKGIEDLVRDISAFDPDLIDARALVARADSLGYSVAVPRLAVLFGTTAEADRSPQETPSALRTEVARTIREQFRDPEDIVAPTSPGRFLLLHRLPRLSADHDDAANVAEMCESVVSALAERHRLNMRAAIGGSGTTLAELKLAVADAIDAFSLAARMSSNPPTTTSVASVRTHQLLAAAPQHAARRLIETEIGMLKTHPDWPLMRQTLIAWCECGFSLVDAADRLHVHRNTLLYRLGRLESLTTRKMRDYPAVVAMYLACLADTLADDGRRSR